jgi:hypothetical protein
MKVNYSIPVTLFNYRESDNPLYSFAKLKIFYVGMTPDKRLFTKKFSDELLKTLPYVPVVGFYDSEEEDFKGHNKLQYIYGLVPETANIEYVKEEDKEYAVCDVILYTGRKDETGEIAKKIVGKSHSLELNPDDVKFKVNRNAEGEIDHIELIAGSLIGLSVLGDDERPAFTGSEFFNENTEILQLFEELRVKLQEFSQQIKRGEKMELNIFESALSFIKKSYNEKIEEISKKFVEKYEYYYVVQLFDDKVIIGYLDESYQPKYARYDYSTEESGEIVIGEGVEVIQRFFTEKEIEDFEKLNEEFKTNRNENLENLNILTVDNVEKSIVHLNDLNNSEYTFSNTIVDAEGENDKNEKNSDLEEGEKNESEAKRQENFEDSSNAALNSSERAELNAFRREKKLNLIESFEEDLEEKTIKELVKEVDSYTFDELEIVLSKEFTKIKKSKNENNKTIIPFYYQPNNSEKLSESDKIKELIERYK